MEKLSALLNLKKKIPPLWRQCLSSAFRTALASIIVGTITLFGPTSIRTLISFPAFSYVTVILVIINDAALGDAFRACWLALYATIQSLGPAMLSLWFIGPRLFSKETISLAVALAAFVVVLPETTTHLIAKRISLAQIVLVYVIAYANGEKTDPIMHPVGLAASTALGVLACVIALLFPSPRLGRYLVNQNYKLLTKNTLKRLKVLVKAINEEDKSWAFGLITHAKLLVTRRTKFLSIIKRYQESMQWERLPIKLFKPHWLSLITQLEEVDTNLRGMELALTNIKTFPVNAFDQDLKHGLNRLEEHVSQTIKHAKQTFLGDSLTVPESNAKSITHFLQSLHTMPNTPQELPLFFFLFCAKLLHNKSFTEDPPVKKIENLPKVKKSFWANSNWAVALTCTNLIPAFKFSLALGLAVFMGLIYSKENGFWSGLPVAVSYVSGREATFRAANLKAHGTVLGTVYGVLGCFVFERFLPIRFLSLLPWFIFTSFLQRSKMYGPAGGISAVIGAVLILGRKNFGPPSEFAVVRIIETFIGLSCSIFVDLMFRPKRASTCAKIALSECLAQLSESIGSLSIVSKMGFEENQRRLKMQVNGLRSFVSEAESEPNFWFLPFNSGCYNKLLGSLSRLVDVFHFGAISLKFLQQEFQDKNEAKEELNLLQIEIEHIKELLCSSTKNFEEICRMKSLRNLEKELQKRNLNISCDLESGKCNTRLVSHLGEDGIEQTIDSFLQRSRNIVDNLYSDEGEKEVKSQLVLSLSALGFCLSACIKGTIEIEEAMKDLVQWENPSSEINLYEISCKLHALNK